VKSLVAKGIDPLGLAKFGDFGGLA